MKYYSRRPVRQSLLELSVLVQFSSTSTATIPVLATLLTDSTDDCWLPAQRQRRMSRGTNSYMARIRSSASSSFESRDNHGSRNKRTQAYRTSTEQRTVTSASSSSPSLQVSLSNLQNSIQSCAWLVGPHVQGREASQALEPRLMMIDSEAADRDSTRLDPRPTPNLVLYGLNQLGSHQSQSCFISEPSEETVSH